MASPPRMTRRDVLKAGALAAASGLVAGLSPAAAKTRVVVVGAGAFGGWTALELLGRGAQVTLLDAWGPGNARASSGGDTRVLRHTYGDSRLYVDMVARSLERFRSYGRAWGRTLFEPTGVLFLVQEDESHARSSIPHLEAAAIEHEVLGADDVARRWPQIHPDKVRWALFEPTAGVLYARRCCRAVVEAFVAAGGDYRVAAAQPGPLRDGRLADLRTSGDGRITADAYVFACGPWLGRMFPGAVDRPLIRPTRQEVFTFGPPRRDTVHAPPRLPVWADHGERLWYGIPGNEGRGFKIADDTRGEAFDPSRGDRTPSVEGLERARAYMEYRFPALKGAPLLEARVCQYENSPDTRFVLDRHPRARNAWLLGGGSGHGFKHGPAVGELAAACVLGEREPEPFFALARLGNA